MIKSIFVEEKEKRKDSQFYLKKKNGVKILF